MKTSVLKVVGSQCTVQKKQQLVCQCTKNSRFLIYLQWKQVFQDPLIHTSTLNILLMLAKTYYKLSLFTVIFTRMERMTSLMFKILKLSY